MAEAEKDISAQDIVLWRRIARMRLPKAKVKASSWSVSSWFGGSKGSESKEDEGAPALDSARKEFLTLLEEEAEFETSTDAAYVGVRVSCDVPTSTILLEEVDKAGSSATLLEANWTGSVLAFEQRPAVSAFKVETKVSDMVARMATPENTLHPFLRSLAAADGTETDVVKLAFETKPIVSGPVRPDSSISLSLAPTEIELFPSMIARLQRFFAVPNEVDLSELSQYYEATVADVQTQARAGLELMVSNRTTLDVQMNIRAPVLILPTSFESREANDPCLIADFGSLQLASKLHPPPNGDVQHRTAKELEGLMYDDYTLNATGLQVLLTPPQGDWRARCRECTPETHLLSKVEASAIVKRCIAIDDGKLPQFRLELGVPEVSLFVSTNTMAAAAALGEAYAGLSSPDDDGARPTPKYARRDGLVDRGVATAIGSAPASRVDSRFLEVDVGEAPSEGTAQGLLRDRGSGLPLLGPHVPRSAGAFLPR